VSAASAASACGRVRSADASLFFCATGDPPERMLAVHRREELPHEERLVLVGRGRLLRERERAEGGFEALGRHARRQDRFLRVARLVDGPDMPSPKFDPAHRAGERVAREGDDSSFFSRTTAFGRPFRRARSFRRAC